MTFDENTLRSVIEEVLKEMGEVSGTAAAPSCGACRRGRGQADHHREWRGPEGHRRRRGGHRPGARLRHQAG
ncbi:MAG: hypothetical protein ACLRNQ_28825 [Flavonifractor plautii]